MGTEAQINPSMEEWDLGRPAFFMREEPLESGEPLDVKAGGWKAIGYTTMDDLLTNEPTDGRHEPINLTTKISKTISVKWLDTSLPMVALMFIGPAGEKVMRKLEKGVRPTLGAPPVGLWLSSLRWATCPGVKNHKEDHGNQRLSEANEE